MRVDYRELKQRVRFLELLTRIGWQSKMGRGEQLRGPCPLPGCCTVPVDQLTGSYSTFSVHTKRNIYQCFRCQSAGSVLDFWQAFRAISRQQAAIELSQMVKYSNHTSS